jgi:pilus assembly protein Flp/PilA
MIWLSLRGMGRLQKQKKPVTIRPDCGHVVDSEGVPQTKPIQKGITTMLFAPKEKGQGLVEYAIILALVAIVVIAVMRLLGPKIGNTFSTINNSLL